MSIEQVKFRCPNSDTIESKKDALGGIAIYEGYKLKGVVCGCCGGLFEPEEIEIIEELPWVPISDEIIGE